MPFRSTKFHCSGGFVAPRTPTTAMFLASMFGSSTIRAMCDQFVNSSPSTSGWQSMCASKWM
jgi:hypothetical protein